MKNPPLQQGHDGPRAPPLRPYQADTLQRMKSTREMPPCALSQPALARHEFLLSTSAVMYWKMTTTY